MEYELQDLNVVRGTKDEGDLHDFTTALLDPSEGDVPITITINDSISRTYNASMSCRRSSDFHRSEDDLYVPLLSFVLIFTNVLGVSLQPIPRETQELFTRDFVPTNYSMLMAVHRVRPADSVYHTD